MSTSAIGSTTAATATSTTPFQPKSEHYTVTDVVLAFFKEKAKDLAKAGSYLAFWATEAMPDTPQNVTKFNTTLRDFKNFISATEVPQKLYDLSGSVMALGGSVKDVFTGAAEATLSKVGSTARKAFKDSMSAINATADTIEFTKLFVPISKETLRWVSGINFAATMGFAGNGVLEQVENFAKNTSCDQKKTAFYMLNTARDVSYLVLGIIGFTCFVTATPIIPMTIVACTTAGLTFTIGSYFYEKLVDPEHKGKNLNPAIVVENVVAQRAASAA